MQLKFFLAALTALLSSASWSKQTTKEDDWKTTVVVSEDLEDEKDEEIARNNAREVRRIRKFCADVDLFVRNNPKARRNFVREANGRTRHLEWREVSGRGNDFLKARVAASAYSRKGSVVFVECVTRNNRNRPPNSERHYFRPDASLAWSRTIYKTFENARLNDDLIFIHDSFLDNKGESVGSDEMYLDAKTGRRRKRVIYSVYIESCFSVPRTAKLQGLTFFHLLQKPKP